MKKAIVNYNKGGYWIIRYWSETEQEYLEDSAYPVINTDKNDIGQVSELFIFKLQELQENGYQIIFL